MNINIVFHHLQRNNDEREDDIDSVPSSSRSALKDIINHSSFQSDVWQYISSHRKTCSWV